MYKSIVLILILALLCTSCGTRANKPDTSVRMRISQQTAPTGRYVILFKDRNDPTLVQKSGGQLIDHVESPYLHMITALLPAAAIPVLQADPAVAAVEPDVVQEVKPQHVDWGHAKTLVPQANAAGLTGKGVKVAVLDTGISPHPDLALAGGVSCVEYTSSYADDDGHGTHVAGIIAASNNGVGVVGVAPDAQLYAVKVLDQTGEGYTSDIVAGINWCITNGMNVINMSFGTYTGSYAMTMVLRQAVENGILCVAAGGNEGDPEGAGETVNYPGRYESVIAVAATDAYNRRATFSASGSKIELAAPGVHVLSTYPGNDYAYMDGTSMAAPYVSGIIALWKERYPDATPARLRQILQGTALDLGAVGRDPYYGYGLVQSPVLFRDIAGHWAEPEIQSAYEHGWLKGTSLTTFTPNGSLTRAQAAVILSRALALPRLGGGSPFADIPTGHWARDEIERAYQNGVMQGLGPITFAPNAPVTRAQMAVMLSRILKLPADETLPNPYTDVFPGHWSYAAVLAVSAQNIFTGMTVTTFAGGDVLTRAQCATLLNRIADRLPTK